jgi:hypothetical protein
MFVSARLSSGPRIRPTLGAIALLPAVVVLACLPPAGGSTALAGAATAGSGGATCKQLTKAQVQPLMSVTVNQVKVTKATSSGQQCVYSNSDQGGQAVDILVIGGSQAKASFQEDVHSLDSKVAVPGVGQTAYRAKGDFQISAFNGKVYCSVSVGSSDTIPGAGAIEQQNGGSAELSESDNAVIAKGLGAICNRIFKKGNTTVSLAGLGGAAPPSTTAVSASAPTGRPIGATQSTKTASEDPEKLTLVKVIDPATPTDPNNAAPDGMRWVGLDFTVVVNGPDSEAGKAFVIGSDGNNYGLDTAYSIGPYSGCTDTADNEKQGKSFTSCFGALVPTGVTVATVAFSGLETASGPGIVYWAGS